MAEKSGYTQKVEQYKAQGLTEGQAVARALTDMAIDMGWDFMGGMLTGGIMGGGSYAGSKVGQAVSDKLYQLAEKMYSGENTTLGEGERIATSPAAPRNDGLETENTAQTDGVKYSIKRTQNMTWDDQINGALSHNGKIVRNDTLVLDNTPDMLVSDGIESRHLAIPLSVITKAKSGKDVSHSITDENLKSLQNGVRNAPIVIHNPSRNALVFVTNIKQNGAPVLVAFNKNSVFDQDTVHKATSIHLQMDVGSMLKALPADATIYAKNKNELEAAVGVADNLRSLAANFKFTGDIVAENTPGVKQNHSTSGGKVLLQGNQGHTFEVELGSVASAGDGKLVMNLQGGGSADVSNMSFPNAGMQALYHAVAKIADSRETAQQLLDGYYGKRIATSPVVPRNESVSAQMYANAAQQVYLYGKLQMPLEEAVRSSNAVHNLSPELRNSIYEMGQRAGQEQTKQAQQKATERSSGRQREGGVFYGYNGQAIDKKKLSPAQRVAVDFAQRLANRKGMTFYFYRSQVNEKGVRVYRDRNNKIVEADNGFYDPSDGSIHIDLNCDNFGDTILFTLAHELTHFIQDTNPEGYRRLCQILTRGYMGMNQSMDQLVKNKQTEYRSKGKNLSYEEAYDEVIAASMESILADGRVLELLDELETKDKSLREQIRSFIEDTARLLKEIIDAYRGKRPTSPEGRIVMRMNTLYEQLQEAFAQSLHEGGENYRQGGQTNTAPEGGRKWSKNSYDSETSSIKEQIASNIEKLNSMDPVAEVLVPTNLTDNRVALRWAAEILKPTGYRVERQNFGTIWFEEDDINYGLNYADTPEERAALILLPRVLKRGIEIARHGNHKLRQKETVTFAAPALVNGTRVNMAAVVTVRNGRYYAHRIVMPDGTVFRFAEQKNTDATQEPPRGVPNAGSLAKATSVASTKTVAQNGAGVKKNSIRYQVNQAAQEHLQEQNAELAEDMEGLQTLVAAQRSANSGRIKAEALGAAASHLMKTAGAKGNQMEQGSILENAEKMGPKVPKWLLKISMPH